MRATLRLSSPAWFAQPRITSSIRSAGIFVRRDERGDHRRGEVIGADAREPAAVAAERRANSIDEIRGAGHARDHTPKTGARDPAVPRVGP